MCRFFCEWKLKIHCFKLGNALKRWQRVFWEENANALLVTFFQGISPIAKIAIAIAISIAIWKKIADRDHSFAIADRDLDHFT